MRIGGNYHARRYDPCLVDFYRATGSDTDYPDSLHLGDKFSVDSTYIGSVKMRDIKFRLWDKLNKSMTYDGTFCFGLFGFKGCRGTTTQTIPGVGLETWEWNIGNNERQYELMQFTGLYDKNNVPVYEGDVVKDVSKNAYNRMVYEVCFGEYDNGEDYDGYVAGHGWYGKVLSGWLAKGDVKGFEVITECKVIGNIYDNPSLIKE